MSQAELAEQMTDAGRPLSRAALLRLEGGSRGLLLDEAVALAVCLSAAPAHLLTPPEGAVVALTDKTAIGDLRDWFATGNLFPFPVWPAKPREEDRALLDRNFEQSVASYAQALIAADKADNEDGRRAALRAIRAAVEVLRDPSRRGGDDA
jgi:hypothetical protein